MLEYEKNDPLINDEQGKMLEENNILTLNKQLNKLTKNYFLLIFKCFLRTTSNKNMNDSINYVGNIIYIDMYTDSKHTGAKFSCNKDNERYFNLDSISYKSKKRNSKGN